MQIVLSTCSKEKMGYGENAPADIQDYLGRLVNVHARVYTVVHVEPSTNTPANMNGSIIPGAAKLYLASEDGDEYGPYSMWQEASLIAATNRTCVNWNYRKDYRLDEKNCAIFFEEAKHAENKRHKARHNAEEQRKKNEEYNQELWRQHTPAWAQAYIVAEYMVDDSDTMTDYFASHAEKRVLLDFCKSPRNNFSQCRKAAALYEPTAKLATEGIEYRENYVGGGGYYLAGRYGDSSGWVIRKEYLNNGMPWGGNVVTDFSHWLEKEGVKE